MYKGKIDGVVIVVIEDNKITLKAGSKLEEFYYKDGRLSEAVRTNGKEVTKEKTSNNPVMLDYFTASETLKKKSVEFYTTGELMQELRSLNAHYQHLSMLVLGMREKLDRQSPDHVKKALDNG